MASTTPLADPPTRSKASNTTTIPSRPTTPLRPHSRTSLRASTTSPSISRGNVNPSTFALSSLEPAFAELSDSMADLEANFMHLQLLNESLGRFNENFGAFLYGLNMSAFCVDFPEAPIPQSFARQQAAQQQQQQQSAHFQTMPSPARNNTSVAPGGIDATFLTTDTSFVDNPPPANSRTPASRYSSVPPSALKSGRQQTTAGAGVGTAGARRGVGTMGGARAGASGIGRGGRGGVGTGAGAGGSVRGEGRGGRTGTTTTSTGNASMRGSARGGARGGARGSAIR